MLWYYNNYSNNDKLYHFVYFNNLVLTSKRLIYIKFNSQNFKTSTSSTKLTENLPTKNIKKIYADRRITILNFLAIVIVDKLTTTIATIILNS